MTTKNRFNCTWKIWKQDSINLLHHLSILDLVELFLHFLNILKRMSRLELCVRFFFSHWDWQSPSKKCELARWSEVKFFDLKERASSLRLDRWQTLATSCCCFLLLFFSVLKKKSTPCIKILMNKLLISLVLNNKKKQFYTFVWLSCPGKS